MGTSLHCKMFQNCMERFTASIKVNKVSKIIIWWNGHIKILRQNLARGNNGHEEICTSTAGFVAEIRNRVSS